MAIGPRTAIVTRLRPDPPVAATGDAGLDLLLTLFRTTPHVMVCVKDVDGRYLAANDAFARRAGCRRAEEVIGRRAVDLFPRTLATSYDAQDRGVLRSGRTIVDQLEPIEDRGGDRRWYSTTKSRHPTVDGPVVAVVSVETRLGGDAASGLQAAVELAHVSTDASIDVPRLAHAAGMSTDRMERAMRRVLGTSPKQYVLRLRAERAAHLLATTELPIAAVAARCGYYDQSQLGRQFRKHLGMTPTEYRAATR